MILCGYEMYGWSLEGMGGMPRKDGWQGLKGMSMSTDIHCTPV